MILSGVFLFSWRWRPFVVVVQPVQRVVMVELCADFTQQCKAEPSGWRCSREGAGVASSKIALKRSLDFKGNIEDDQLCLSSRKNRLKVEFYAVAIDEGSLSTLIDGELGELGRRRALNDHWLVTSGVQRRPGRTPPCSSLFRFPDIRCRFVPT